jgi:hypothetical protein
VTRGVALSHYGGLHGSVARVTSVHEFKSPDLRLLCNAVCFAAPHCSVSPRSTFDVIRKARGEGADGAEGGDGGFVLFHFFRPNRAPSELAQPLQKFYVHKPDLAMLGAFAGKGGKPSRDAISTPARKRAAAVLPMPRFTTPTTYQHALPERAAIRPGGCFGNRALMWGYWY